MDKVKNMKKTVSVLLLGLSVFLQSDSLLASPGFLSRNGDSKLHKAVMAEDLTAVINCYKKNPKLLEKGDKQGRTPLRYAIGIKNDFIVSYLIDDCEANVNVIDKNGTSVLQLAIIVRSAKIEGLLLEAGANVHYKNIKRESALHIASTFYDSYDNSFDIVTLLLAAGADLNALDLSRDKPDLDDYWEDLMSKDWRNISPVYRNQLLGAAIVTVINKYNLNATKVLSEDWQGRLDMNLFEYK